MAFTRSWDNTSPTDQAAANQLGTFLRNFKQDFQEREAAMSGSDTPKPTYTQDAQAANWTGRIYLAFDTGNLYRFNNPGFTNIGIFGKKKQVLKDQGIRQNYEGINTTPITIGNPITLPPLTPTTMFRITMFQQAFLSDPTPGTSKLLLNLNQGLIAIFGLYSPVNSEYMTRMLSLGSNQNDVSSQTWNSFGDQFSVVNGNPYATRVDTSVGTTISLQWQSSNAADILAYYGLLVELFF